MAVPPPRSSPSVCSLAVLLPAALSSAAWICPLLSDLRPLTTRGIRSQAYGLPDAATGDAPRRSATALRAAAPTKPPSEPSGQRLKPCL